MCKRPLDKQFQIRDSPFTIFKTSETGKSIYNTFITTFIFLLAHRILYDYTKSRITYFGLRLFVEGFTKIPSAILVWCLSNVLALLNYWCFILWARTSTKLGPKARSIWNKICITLLSFYYFFLIYGFHIISNNVGFGVISATILAMEQLRILMKQHAFIRTNAPRVLLFKIHSDQTLELPNFGKFLYFMFAPTMIYRDEYPRTSQRRWKFVIERFAEACGVTWFLILLLEELLVPPFKDTCLKKITWGEIVTLVSTNVLPGIVSLLSAQFIILHSFQNAFAEMLRFGDRMFYKDYWNSKCFSEFYRTWNVVVRDWLHTYVYRDFYEVIVPNNKVIAKSAVFLLSAAFHEWMFLVGASFFLPINLILFFPVGAGLTLLNKLHFQCGNLAMMLMFFLGTSMEVNLYALEISARINCPLNTTGLDSYIPRFISCGCVG